MKNFLLSFLIISILFACNAAPKSDNASNNNTVVKDSAIISGDQIPKELIDLNEKVNDKRRIIVWNDLVENPIELRYAWARNPLGNLVNDAERIIPVPLFRTDSWDYPEAPYLSSEYELYRQKQKTIQQQAEQLARIRIIQEAERLIKENKK